MFNVYVVNLAKYNEGRITGKWIELPVEMEVLQAHIKSVLGDDEEYSIHDYDNDYNMKIGEYENIFRLNEIAELLESHDETTVRALMEVCCDVETAIEKLENGDYTILNDIDDEEDLGYQLIHELGYMEIPEKFERYFDYDKYGSEAIDDGWDILPKLNLAVLTH